MVVFYPMFGFLMSIWSWQSIFHVSGVFGTLWYVAWLYFVYDSPDKHPRINPIEKAYIQECLGDSVHEGKVIFIYVYCKIIMIDEKVFIFL